ncbi:hypothetical protein ACP4OV_007232 [Aristida adscensionis]
MGKTACCEKVGLRRGRWTADEDQKLASYIAHHGQGSWRSIPKNAGKAAKVWQELQAAMAELYLRPDVKRGRFSEEEDSTIVQLHAAIGNRSRPH